MNDIKFTKTNGGMGRKAASEDPISGLIMTMSEMAAVDFNSSTNALQFDQVTVGTSTSNHILNVAKLSYPEQLEQYGIVEEELSMHVQDYGTSNQADAFKKRAAKNALVYHVKEFFRMNPSGTLYLGIIGNMTTQAHPSGDDVKALQNYANGAIRQCGVVVNGFTDSVLTGLQSACLELENTHKPLSVVAATSGVSYTVTVPATVNADTLFTLGRTAVTGLSLSDFNSSNYVVLQPNSTKPARCNVSLLIGCDIDASLSAKLGHYANYGCIGLCIGAISKAAVNESIAWVQKFPLGLKKPGLISGESISEVSDNDQDLINTNRYIFVITHVGDANNYFNDSHTCDVATSDYAFIENVRTIDKACRGVRANLLPYLNSPLKVDAETGKLDSPMVAFLETTAGKALEEMEATGELSGYRVEIDPEQNVISTSQLEIVIKNVPTGVMRKVNVKIGFTTALN